MPGMPVADRPLEKPAWPLALLVMMVDLMVLGAPVGFGPLRSAPELSAALLVLYLAQLVSGAVMLALPRRRRLGKALLFGGLIAPGVGILALTGVCIGPSLIG